MGIISDLLRKASKKYEKIDGKLYVKAKDPDKQCGVCFLGGIALEGRPDRFVVNKRKGVIIDKETGLEPKYEDILLAIGVPENKIDRKYTARPKGYEPITNSNLTCFIPSLNDSTSLTFEQAADWFEKKGL